ncbi:molybdenum cofactor biosynthesis protein B [Citricoccus sp. K5]|uniref:MogA/MoaB family molybdenum cofactor biosynthesis protein n=1 Tax=Citricoccus sp. K5 TaxID=2653135 RepID=UPI0012F1A518|nr:MogA/MoaB family molybdenum cofactor biosynthesis protein [Citricoccus sp. K5]VXB26440.1 Molybdenum cofactor synthesis domain-containing protein [Citricoccus sp. K5]
MPHIHILTVSDRAHAGQAPDTAGPRALELAAQYLSEWTADGAVVADGVESVRSGVRAARSDGADVVITLGGTGVSPRDLTPEAMDGLLDTELPGIAEMLRREGAEQTPTAALGRGRAGIIGRTLVVNLPGSLRATEQGIPLLAPVLPHLLAQLGGGGDHARH